MRIATNTQRPNRYNKQGPAGMVSKACLKEATISVEGVLQVIYDRPGVSLTSIELPSSVPRNIRKMFRCLYGLGSGTEGARHASIEGNEPTGPRAELAIHVAAALHAFAVSELLPG